MVKSPENRPNEQRGEQRPRENKDAVIRKLGETAIKGPRK